MIMMYFRAASLLTKIAMIGAVIAALGTAYGLWYYHVWSNGYDYALAAVAKQDSKAVAKATEYRNTWRDCRARGLQWQQQTGKCVGG